MDRSAWNGAKASATGREETEDGMARVRPFRKSIIGLRHGLLSRTIVKITRKHIGINRS